VTARAVIIAIQDYPDAVGLVSKQLPGTHEAARRFHEWLRSHGVEERDIWVNTDDASFPGAPGRMRDGASASIRATFQELVPEAAGGTAQLFVFFSGHGFVRTDLQFGPDGPVKADVLVAADFVSLGASGVACFPLDGLQQSLRTWLGPGDHYWFVDACRNECKSGDVAPGGLLLSFPPVGGDPGVYTLFSTQRGFAAATGSGFAGHLVDGLHGRSRAKRWHGDSLVVLFQSLQEYVAAQMTTQQVQQRVEARGEGRICGIEPVPSYHCDLAIEGAPGAEPITVEVEGLRPATPPYAATFTGTSHRFVGPPDDYWVRVEAGTVPPLRGRARVDLYEDRQVSVRLEGAVPKAPALPGGATRSIRIGGTGAADVHLVSRADDTVRIALGPAAVPPPSGRYQAVVTDARSGIVLNVRDIDLTEEGDVDLESFTRWSIDDRPRLALLNQLPWYARHPDAVEFSESVGPIADQDIDVWLAMVGASRIVGHNPGQWEKIGHLDLFDASTAAPGDSPVYVLAALDLPERSPAPPPGVTVSLWPDGRGVRARAVPGLEGWFEAVVPATEGPKLLTIAVDGHPPRTTVTHCLANRATLVTYSVGAAPAPVLRQYVLLMGHLLDQVPVVVRDRLAGPSGRSALDWVRFAAQCQRLFSSHQAIEPTGPDLDIWRELVYGKWVDPVMGVVAAYELVRAGEVAMAEVATRNLAEFFPGLPDVAYLRQLVGQPPQPPPTPPLVRDGAIGLGFTSFAGLPAEHLDYSSPWTAWLNAEPGPPSTGP
jgi:hypothetical protein